MTIKTKIVLIINYTLIGMLFILNILASIYFFTGYPTERTFDENIMKVVEIKVSDDEITWGYATGCLIDNNGTILTNKHVVLNSSTEQNYSIIQVRFADNENYLDAQILNVSTQYDLATIKVDKVNTQFFEFAQRVLNGETIFTIGNPNGFGLSFSTGVISINSRNVIFGSEIINAIQTDLVINEGNSGGPVFNKEGKLLGLISFRLKDAYAEVIQGVSFAVPINDIKLFLNQ